MIKIQLRRRTFSRLTRIGASSLLLTAILWGSPIPSTAVVNGSSDAQILPTSIGVRDGYTVQISGARKLIIQPGSCWVNDKLVQMKQARVVDLPPAETKAITGEQVNFNKDFMGNEFAVLPGCVFDTTLKIGVIDILVPKSLTLKSGVQPGAKPYIQGKDYNVTGTGVITKVKGGALTGVKTMYANYAVNLRRVDSIAVDESGSVRFATGASGKWAVTPPVIPDNFLALYNVYSYPGKELTPEDVLCISSEPPPIMLTTARDKNREALKSVRTKLERGKAVNIIVWGDSITYGTGATSPDNSYVSIFEKRLRQRYPRAKITIDRQGLVNANTALRGPTFAKDILTKSPDLVIFEFLNDMLFPAPTVSERYVGFFKLTKLAGSDILLVAPHLPSTAFVAEKGPSENGSVVYCDMLRTLIKTDPTVAFADVAGRWAHFEKEGLKRESFLVDGVHPSDLGHATYADQLMKCFE